jgi:hypothetical protein
MKLQPTATLNAFVCGIGNIACIAVLACLTWAQDANTGPRPVRNAKQAREIAEAALVHKYGKAVRAERPFNVKLEGGVWAVSGTTYCQEQLPSPGFYCPEWHWVRISKKDGHIVAIGESQPIVR